MGIGDLFKASKNKSLEQENAELKTRIAELEASLTPEMLDLDKIRGKINAEKQALADLTAHRSEIANQLEKNRAEIASFKSQLVETKEEILLQSFGLYTPRYAFANSTMYKDRLKYIRDEQKQMVKDGTAATGTTDWTVNNSASAGKKMVADITKLLLRAFNSECDDVIEHVKFSNLEASAKRIQTASETISKLGRIMSISIQSRYIALKLEELYLAHEFQVKKQEEKETLRQLRAEERERLKVEKEILEARKKIEKEQQHFSNAYKKLVSQISKATPEDLPELEAKKAELMEKMGELDKSMEDIDYREAHQKAGYVYIISNIGAFGENVYKIGMTRRLDPMDRIDELGDASVPFNFDVHAMIFTENAPALENALHKAFEDRKLNMINHRREFFRVTLEEIEAEVKKNHDKTVEFTRVAPAQQYRESLLLKADILK